MADIKGTVIALCVCIAGCSTPPAKRREISNVTVTACRHGTFMNQLDLIAGNEVITDVWSPANCRTWWMMGPWDVTLSTTGYTQVESMTRHTTKGTK